MPSTTTYPTMAEPASSTGAAGFAAYKLAIAFGLPAAAAAVVVMLWAQPTSRREWATALICTVVSSVCGGAMLVQYLGVQAWAETVTGLIAMGGLIFASGLPGWIVVRAGFAWADRRRHKDLAELAQEVRNHINGATQ